MALNWGGGATGALGGGAAGSTFGPIGTAGGAVLGGLAGLFSPGEKKEKIRNQSTLRGSQEPLLQQAINAGLNPGGSGNGAFGGASNYYNDLLSNDSATMNQLSAPELRQFNEQTIPDISEQFAGMGSGGLSSSGFQNAAIGAGTDLSERLGAIRAQLRQQGAQGLQSIGQVGLGNYGENVRNQPQAGFTQNVAEGIGNVLPAVANSWMNKTKTPQQNSFGGDKVGRNTGAYGSGGPQASPQLPNFLQR